ncbi:unnamed protein product [Rotaria socialis]|uniref:Uncharacterized protein n=2 Tax=Rotaria socialis TaxID=392032 RepID=A0A818X979_9BILA|nr:unnamed protein product [Rotaria socialis]
MLSRPQKPMLRDFMLMHAQTRAYLCSDEEIFDPCTKLIYLTSFEKATLTSWSLDSNVDKGLNLYILVHFLSSINDNSYYYHYVNNGNPDGTNMFGHIIGTSGSGKSSALTPHMDALGRALVQLDINQNYTQYPNKTSDLSFEQPFIISNATALHVYRSLIYGNRLLCSTECDTLLSNLGVYGNQYNDPRFAENVNMLIQMFDGTKHQNRSTLSTSYVIPEGRRASIIGASVGDPYARVSQQHYEGNGISGAHNRFTHYPCPVMKAIKTNAGSAGVTSNMVPSLQHVYAVSMMLGKVEYVARQNVYDKSEKKKTNMFSDDVEDKWKRLRPMAVREYYHSPLQIEIELEEPEAGATIENSNSAFYYMFSRVYSQWQEATITEKQEHEAIINFKNSTKIPRFICNFARFRTIMNILWHDDVYPFIEISEVMKPPYCISDNFIEAVKTVIDKLFPPNLCKTDGTKILIIEKDTAIMGDLFFGHVDCISRKLFDLSQIQETFNSSLKIPRLLKNAPESYDSDQLIYKDASMIILSKLIFFSVSTFIYHRVFHNKKDRLNLMLKYLVDNELIYEGSHKNRFIKGAHTSYGMKPPNQIKKSDKAIEALAKLNLNIQSYEELWQQCLLPVPEMAAKIEISAINHINLYLVDYISIIHRLGDANDPVAKEILRPGLISGQIGIDFDSNTFSLAPEHIVFFNNDHEIMNELNRLCIRANPQTMPLLNNTKSLMNNNNLSVSNSSNADKTCVQPVDNSNKLPPKQTSFINFNSVFSKEYCETDTSQNQCLSIEESEFHDIIVIALWLTSLIYFYLDDCISVIPDTNNNNINDCIYVLDRIKTIVENDVDNINVYIKCVTTIQKPNNCSSMEFDDPTTNSMIINDIDFSVCYQQNVDKESLSDSSSTTSPEYVVSQGSETSNCISMEEDSHIILQSLSSDEVMPNDCNEISENSQRSLDKETTQSIKKFDVIALSKRLMLKSFVTFTKTDVTRLYNNAETKNLVIEYLQENGFIKKIDDLFLSSAPVNKTFKPEIGYLKLFPISELISETSSFEMKLRDKVGITFDHYVKAVFYQGNLSMLTTITNNMFNTARHNWLLNRNWFEKLKEGHISTYYRSNVICPDVKISPMIINITSVSNDSVHDSFDRPKSKLTASQRTKKELKLLGAKRLNESTDHPPLKRQRKPKKFHDDS